MTILTQAMDCTSFYFILPAHYSYLSSIWIRHMCLCSHHIKFWCRDHNLTCVWPYANIEWQWKIHVIAQQECFYLFLEYILVYLILITLWLPCPFVLPERSSTGVPTWSVLAKALCWFLEWNIPQRWGNTFSLHWSFTF